MTDSSEAGELRRDLIRASNELQMCVAKEADQSLLIEQLTAGARVSA